MNLFSLKNLALLYIIQLSALFESKFIEIKTLSSGKYFILFSKEASIYNNDFTKNKQLFTFNEIQNNYF